MASPAEDTQPKVEEIESHSKAGKCGVTLYEYKCGHSTRTMSWNTLCGAHDKCDPSSAVIEMVDAACVKCGVGIEIDVEAKDGGSDEKDRDVKLEYQSTLSDPAEIASIQRELEFEMADLDDMDELPPPRRVRSRNSSPASNYNGTGALSEPEDEELNPFARQNSVNGESSKVASPVQEHESVELLASVQTPVNDENLKLDHPVSKHAMSEKSDRSTKTTELQATAPAFIPTRAAANHQSHETTLPTTTHEGIKMNGTSINVAQQEVTVELLPSNPKRITLGDSCSKFQPLGLTHIEGTEEITNNIKQTKYTPPMFWKHASANAENNTNASQVDKPESDESKGKSVNGVQHQPKTFRVVLGPVSNYAKKSASPALERESFAYGTNGTNHTQQFNAMNDENRNDSSPAYQYVNNGLPRDSQRSASNDASRNKVPFLPSRSTSMAIKEEPALDAEAYKFKKLQKTLITLAITREVEAIFANVQAEQKIKLEDWFANVAPMHLAAMQKAAVKKDRDAQVQALRASFADNGKFLGGMLVDRILEDAKDEVIRKCEEGVEKLLNTLL
jgi:hypothetical protein